MFLAHSVWWPMVCVLASYLMLAGCAEGTDQKGIPDFSLMELAAAPARVEHAGRSYRLETYLWRDFMPMSPPGGKGLTATVRLVEVDSQAIADGVSLDFLWVIHGEEVWATLFSGEERPSGPAFKLEAVARDGPQWQPNREVDVVVGWRDAAGELHLVRAAGQKIHRTD